MKYFETSNNDKNRLCKPMNSKDIQLEMLWILTCVDLYLSLDHNANPFMTISNTSWKVLVTILCSFRRNSIEDDTENKDANEKEQKPKKKSKGGLIKGVKAGIGMAIDQRRPSTCLGDELEEGGGRKSRW